MERLQWNHTFLFDLNILVNKANFQNKSNGHTENKETGMPLDVSRYDVL